MPKRTIQLLDQLQALGFRDAHFAILHHFGMAETIHGMRAYCATRGEFQKGGTNEKVKARLELVLAGTANRDVTPDAIKQLCLAAARDVPKPITTLFREEPETWALRGDPALWREMADAFAHMGLPKTEEEFRTQLEQMYRALTGVPLSSPGPVYVERYADGGMSRGQVDPAFWADQVIPMLLTRLRHLNPLR